MKTGIKTDAKGEAELGWISRDGKLWLLPGEYELLETKAPDGYFPIEDPISIKIEKGKASYQQPGADKATELTLENVASFTVEVTNKPKYGDLKIIKYLPTYEVSEEATFVFDVVGKDDDGNVVYTNVAVLTLKKEGSRSTVLHHIPDGAHITVTERYTGSHYELDSAANQTTTIVANRTVSVKDNSVMLMPASVALASFPASRICTRVTFTRFFARYSATAMFAASETSPTSVITRLYRIMMIR